jgi:RNA polymerase sigma-70 factor (ECF subfamily)
MTSELDDNQLVLGCLGGDEHAFEVLLLRYQRPVFNAVLRMVRNRDDAFDLAQATFVKAYERLASFDPAYKFFSWLYRIAVNESINHLRRRGRLEPLDAERACPARNPEDAVLDGDLTRHVQDALMSISSDYRAVIILRHFEDCSYDEIAQIVGVPEKTVKSRLFSARRALRERLEARGILR